VTKKVFHKQVLCLVLMNYRVKVIIPQTEIWFGNDDDTPNYLVKNMVGAKIDYVITNVDRVGECAIASRRMALNYVRYRFFRDRQRNAVGSTLKCNILVVGPKRLIMECCGFDIRLWNRELSYTAIADLRTEFRSGQEIYAKLTKVDKEAGEIEVSVKEVSPNPFYGADTRHPVNCHRQAIISGTYAGGVFCRLRDDTTCLCQYSPSYFSEEFYIGDSVIIAITKYDYERLMIYGKILSKI